MDLINKIKNRIAEILFPPADISAIQVFQTLFCPICQARLAENVKICHRDAPYKLAAASRYDGSVKNLIWKLKYRKKKEALDPLGQILRKYVEALGPLRGWKNSLIVPMPLFYKKERERGFNQSFLIGKILSEALRRPLRADALIKIKDTPPQMKIADWNKRKENVAGSFAVRHSEPIAGRKIILADDIWTSGATMNEAARILKAAGAREILAFVIAKAG
jgi:ComF family protein